MPYEQQGPAIFIFLFLYDLYAMEKKLYRPKLSIFKASHSVTWVVRETFKCFVPSVKRNILLNITLSTPFKIARNKHVTNAQRKVRRESVNTIIISKISSHALLNVTKVTYLCQICSYYWFD